MQRQQKRTLAIALLALSSIALTITAVNTERQRALAEQPAQFFPAAQADLIEMHYQQQRTVVQRGNAGWQIIDPIQASADQQRIAALLRLLTVPQSTAYPADTVDLVRLGLSPAIGEVRINDLTFLLGGPGPGEQQRYLMVNETVYLTRDIILPIVAAGVEAVTVANQ